MLCNDGGVLFTETSSDQPMPDYGIGRSAKPDLRRYIREVNPLRVVGRDVPLFTVRRLPICVVAARCWAWPPITASWRW